MQPETRNQHSHQDVVTPPCTTTGSSSSRCIPLQLHAWLRCTCCSGPGVCAGALHTDTHRCRWHPAQVGRAAQQDQVLQLSC
jgi:hypothetical protein